MARKRKKVKILTLDTETYNGLLGRLKRLAIYDGSKVTYGYTFQDVEPEILRYKKEGYEVHIYIHNMEFDLRKMPIILKKAIWEKSFIINGKLATLATKDAFFHDSFKLLPSSLKSLSKDFNVEHGKLDLMEEVEKVYPGQYKDLVDFLDRCHVDDEVFLKYLGYDVISLYEVLKVLQNLTGLNDIDFVGRISTSSLSRFLFKNGYKGEVFKNPLGSKTDFEIMTQYNWRYNLDTEEFIRCAYYGGRVEVFKPRLEVPGFHYDVNSLYPAQFDAEYPVGKCEKYEDSTLVKFYFERWQNDKMGYGFMSCKVNVPKQNIPPLPVKMGKLVFPCGVFYGTWTFEEIDYAVKNCGVEILEYYEVAYFPNTYPVFKRFKDCFYKMKEEGTATGNKSLRTLGKLILNVMYGYTGMNRDDKTQLRPIKEIDEHKKIIFADEELGYIEVPADINADYIQVQIAAAVTSKARLVLLDALRKCDERGNVYYCDTDSIVTDVPMPPEMVHASKLGYWDLEGEPQRAIFLRPKVYAEVFKDDINVKFKGVTKETQATLDFESYENLYNEILNLEKDEVIIEKNRLTLRSIMYLQKNHIDFNNYNISDKESGVVTGYEMRDKKMNLNTVEKRNVDYKKNTSAAWYFATEEEYENFDFNPPKKEVQFSMTTGGHH